MLKDEGLDSNNILKYILTLKFDFCHKVTGHVLSHIAERVQLSKKKEKKNNVLSEDVNMLSETNE